MYLCVSELKEGEREIDHGKNSNQINLANVIGAASKTNIHLFGNHFSVPSLFDIRVHTYRHYYSFIPF